ncbi:MAG: exosortase/archaeosortase family protein [Planctomycetota bacterium]
MAPAVFPFWHVWLDMVQVALRDETFGYALAIPPMAAWITWRRLRGVAYDPRGRGAGVAIVALGLAVHGLSLFRGGPLLTYGWYGGALLVLVGYCTAALGVRALRALLPVFALLVLVVPIPPGIVSTVGHQLMYLSATVTADLLRIMGVPVEQFLYLLVVDGTPVNIVEACSGLRSFFALFGATAVFVAACRLRWGVALLLLGLTPVLAVTGNFARLFPTALLQRYASEDVAHAAHDLLGFVSVLLAVAITAGVLATLRWAGFALFASRQTADDTGPTAADSDGSRAWWGWARTWPVWSCAALVLGVGTAGSFFEWPSDERSRYHAAVSRAVLGVDLTLDGWTPTESELDEWSTAQLQPNAARRIGLTPPHGAGALHASLIHCRYQRDLAYHTPPSCYPSAGWNLQDAQPRSFTVEGHAVTVTEYTFARVSHDRVRRIAVHNLLVMPNGRTAADPSAAFGANIQQGRQDPWGVAQLTVVFPDESTPEQRLDATRGLVARCWPALTLVMHGRDPASPPALALAEKN